MKLADQMYDSVADVVADHAGLAAAAREHGRRQRRRRHGLATMGAAAAIAGIVGGALALQSGHEPPSREQRVADTPTDRGLSGETAPATAESTAAALRAAVEQVADGELAAFAGQDTRDRPSPYDQEVDTYAELELTPPDGGAGEVGLNLQPITILANEDGELTGLRRCYGWMTGCTVSELPNGDILRTYREDDVGIRSVAELLSPDRGLRVVASATNGLELPADKWEVTREDAVLSTAQLTEIVTRSWWGFELPIEYAEAGEELDVELISSVMVPD